MTEPSETLPEAERLMAAHDVIVVEEPQGVEVIELIEPRCDRPPDGSHD